LTLRLVVVVAGVALGLGGWIFWFLAYRDADNRAREANELLTSLAIKIQQRDVAGCVPIAQKVIKRAGLYVEPRR
jgi:hypothetical protein